MRVRSAGVCHTDLHIIRGDIPFPTPAVLGHEVAGIVEEVGEGVTDLRPGDRVVGTFIIPCGRCFYCRVGREDLCENFYRYNRLQGLYYDGDTRLRDKMGNKIYMYSMASHAELSVIPETAVFKLPDGMPLEISAVIGCALLTAYGACKNASLKPSETVAVFGVGGVGSSIVQIASKVFRTKVIAVDIVNSKLEHARSLGADFTINSLNEDPIKKILEITDGRGVDASFEAVGLPITIDQAIRSVRAGGRAVIIGLSTKEAVASFQINYLVRRGIQLIGSYGARPRIDVPEILDLISRKIIDIASIAVHRFKLEEINEALEKLEKGEIKGRAVINP
ncbi:MAG: zinc-binding dehydrogenase [Desulfurococcales archaeon]|nr:zinc-binding dehydrogenase [Desulfurococcales archaeon]